MKKAELAKKVAAACDLSDAAGAKALEAVFEAIKQELAEGQKVAIPQFGSFEPRDRAARQGRNPQTGASIEIAASRTVGFKPATALKQAVAIDKGA